MSTTTGRKIRAKFESKCLACGRRIEIGDECRWFKGAGVECADASECSEVREMNAEWEAERRMEEGAEMRITGAWAYNAEYGGCEEPPEMDDWDGGY